MESAFAAATDALFADPNLSLAAIYRAGGTGDGVPVRLIPLAERPGFGGDALVAMTNAGRAFLVHRDDLAGQTLKTGDTLAIDGATWRVRSAHERPPLAWAVDCTRIG